jgi:hypothetical protein
MEDKTSKDRTQPTPSKRSSNISERPVDNGLLYEIKKERLTKER